MAALKNPTPNIVYEEHNHERLPPGVERRAFAYFVVTAGRFVYASIIRLLIIKLVLSMSASKDMLALSTLEVDLSNVKTGSTVDCETEGKPCSYGVEPKRV